MRGDEKGVCSEESSFRNIRRRTRGEKAYSWIMRVRESKRERVHSEERWEETGRTVKFWREKKLSRRIGSLDCWLGGWVLSQNYPE